MTLVQGPPTNPLPIITWQKLPDDFVLSDEPVESNIQPLLAAALRESLELAGLIIESMLIASNFGICACVGDKTVVKAPDWVYVPSVHPLPAGEIRRSYTPNVEGDKPSVVMEFISATEGGEYSINPHYSYGKWFFYEQILRIPVYVIFHPQIGVLEVYFLVDGKYQKQPPDQNQRFFIEALDLSLGVWTGRKAEIDGHWLRWWDKSGNLLSWGSELVAQERQRAEQERQRAEQAEEKAFRLAEKLREMGLNPEDI
jgi:Uma2 family endonuclease